MRVGWFSGVGQNIQEVGRYNIPPFSINRIFPKLVHPVLGILGVPNVVVVDLEELNARNGWILESAID